MHSHSDLLCGWHEVYEIERAECIANDAVVLYTNFSTFVMYFKAASC